MERWEYMVVQTQASNEWRKTKRAEAIRHLHERINELGADGWEMVGFNAFVVPSAVESVGLCFLKRKLA